MGWQIVNTMEAFFISAMDSFEVYYRWIRLTVEATIDILKNSLLILKTFDISCIESRID
tara:strand:- start:251 stop:427 length:177 start_codon:yes stop_codon:yes gene_type:complete